jgi:hypothetical protein
MKMKLVVTSILVVIAVSVIFYVFVNREYFTTNSEPTITIWKKEKTSDFLRNDRDGYVQLMSSADLTARKASTVYDYLSTISRESASEPSAIETALIKNAIKKVNTFLRKNKSKLPPYISPTKLHDIPWKIALTKGRKYEDGMPHTRENVIIINHSNIKSIEFSNTLLHEKIHVYQRMYPEDVAQWMRHKGFVMWKPRSQEPLSRSNPDLDPYIYIDPISKQPMLATYTSETPSSISDVKLSTPSFEHPYEYLAYEVASKM